MKELSYKLFFKAFSNTTRFGIIKILRKGSLNVSQICEKTGFEQSRVSHNLAYLRAWGFVSSRTEGKTRIYSLDEKHIKPILADIDKFMKKYEKKLCTCGILKGNKKCKHLKR